MTSRRAWTAAIAVAAAVALVVGGVALVRGRLSPRSGSGSEVAEAGSPGASTSGPAVDVDRSEGWAVRDPSGAVVGRVWMRTPLDRPARLVVELGAAAPAGAFRVECDYESGGPYRAGRLEVSAGRPTSWTAGIGVGVYDLQRVRLVALGGGPNLEAEVGSP